MKFETREQWLNEAAGRLLVAFFPAAAGRPLKLSFGWPKGSRKAVGECYHTESSVDHSTHHIFISPKLTLPGDVLHVLLHELVHAVVGVKEGHRGAFSKAAKKVGLTKPWTATTPDAELQAKLGKLSDELGELPHIGMIPEPKKQTTRMKLWECSCGMKIRRAGELNARCLECGSNFVLQG